MGHLAKQMLGRTPDSISVVRPLADGVITDFELCEAMLRYFLRKARRQGCGVKPRVLVAVPGCITPVEKRAVYNSAQRAGARQVFVMPEAKAAAIGAGLPIAEPVASMICDIGGGTTEVAVLSLGDVVASQSIRVAATRWTRPSSTICAATTACASASAAAERLTDRDRQRLSAGRRAQPTKSAASTPSAACRARPRSPAKKSAKRLADPLSQIVDAIKATLDGCSPTWPPTWSTTAWCWPAAGRWCAGSTASLSEQTGPAHALCARPALGRGPRHLHLCLEHFDRWQSSPAIQRRGRVRRKACRP